ncbi:hypothetical protein B0H13DRAFT_1854772 [Mycena leptocephala]|nr:hypothetical protein B0H13DRAFT_1854772 [Mycena leptocephala]
MRIPVDRSVTGLNKDKEMGDDREKPKRGRKRKAETNGDGAAAEDAKPAMKNVGHPAKAAPASKSASKYKPTSEPASADAVAPASAVDAASETDEPEAATDASIIYLVLYIGFFSRWLYHIDITEIAVCGYIFWRRDGGPTPPPWIFGPREGGRWGLGTALELKVPFGPVMHHASLALIRRQTGKTRPFVQVNLFLFAYVVLVFLPNIVEITLESHTELAAKVLEKQGGLTLISTMIPRIGAFDFWIRNPNQHLIASGEDRRSQGFQDP